MVASSTPRVVTFPGNGANVDAFGRQRFSEPVGTYENKNVDSRNRDEWEEITSGSILEHGTVTGGPFVVGDVLSFSPDTALNPIITVTAVNAGSVTVSAQHIDDVVVGDTMTASISGASAPVTSKNTGSYIRHLPAEAAVELQTGTNTGDRAVRQSHRYIPYVPGKSQKVTMTFVNGVTGSLSFNIRSKASGSVVNNRVASDDWEIDTFGLGSSGLNPSGVTIDASKAQIFSLDFQWLGVGTVRLGFNIGGVAYPAHQFDHANIVSQVYMALPSLPIRYEIETTATEIIRRVGYGDDSNGIFLEHSEPVTGAVATMKEICCAVESEGGFFPPGLEYSTPLNEWAERSITARTPILAIRLKNAISADITENRRTVKILDAGFFCRTNDAAFEVTQIDTPTSITATWADIPGGSTLEYSTDITAVTGNPEHIVDGDFLASGQGSFGSSGGFDTDILNLHSFINQNFDSTSSQMYVVYATPRTGTSNVTAHLTWVEFI